MNYIDIIIAIPLVWAIYKGFTKGFVISIASLLALILGIYGAVKLSHITSFYLIEHFSFSDKYLPIIAFAVTFIIIVLLVHMVAKVVDKLVKAIALGFINRLLGVVFNFIKVAFILSIVVVIIEGLDKSLKFMPQEQKESSLMYVPLSKFAPTIFPYLTFEKIKENPITEYNL